MALNDFSRLSDFSEPRINDVAAKRVLANEMMYGVAQGEICGAYRGITEKFSNDTSGAQIRVIKWKPLSQKARDLGASINGGNFQDGTEQPATIEFGINVLTTLDKPITIAEHSKDMLPVDILAAEMKNWNNLLNRNINGMTLAYQIHSVLANDGTVIGYTDGTDKLVDKFIEANATLDEGDEENDIDSFAQDSRIFQVKASYRPKLMNSTTGVLSIGGSVYAQKMLADGTLSPNATVTKLENGYIGDVDGVPVHIVAPILYRLAEEYLGYPAHELDRIIAVCSAAEANARGIAINKEVKIVDAIAGQGTILQPKVRLGMAVFYPKGNVLIAENGYQKTAVAAETVYSDWADKGIIAPASRQAKVAFAWDTSNKNKVTPTIPTGTTVSAAKTCVILKANLPAVDSLEAVNAATKKTDWTTATLTSGSATTVTMPTASAANAGEYRVYLVAFLSDGTIQLSKSDAIVVGTGS